MIKALSYIMLSNIFAGLCIIIGFTAAYGWLSHSLFLIQINEHFAPIQFNTTLCMLFTGFSLIFLNNEKKYWARVIASGALLISGLTLIEYLTNISLGIDEFFIKAYISTNPTTPGRMAPNGAIGILSCSICLLLLSLPYSSRYIWMNLICIFLTLSLGFLSIIGYFTDFTTHFGFGQWIKISVHTAVGLIFLSLGMLGHIYSRKNNSYVPLAPFMIAFLIINTAFLGWQNLKKSQENYFNILLQLKIKSVSDVINTYMQERVNSFSRITYRWINRDVTPEDEWREDIKHYIHDQSGYIAIEWLDEQFKVRWIEPEIGNELSKEFQYFHQEPLAQLIRQSIKSKATLLSSPINLNPIGTGVFIFSPIIKSDKFHGFMVGIMNTQVMLDNIISKTGIHEYGLKVINDNSILYENVNQNMLYYEHWNKHVQITVYGQAWTIVLWPSITLYRTMMSSGLPTLVMLVGFIIALMAGFLVHSMQLIKRNSLKLNKAQNELANTHERLQGMIEGSTGLIAAIDRDQNYIAFNSMYKSEIYRLFRINLTLGMNLEVILKRMNMENRKKVTALWTRALNGDSFTIQEEFQDKHIKGLHYEIHYNPIRDSHNQIIGASHMATNIYQRIQDGIILENSRKELQSSVADLEKQNKDLELLKELMSLLQSSITLQDAVETIGSYARRILLNTSGMIYLTSELDNNLINNVLVWGEPEAKAKNFNSSDCLALLRHQQYRIDNTEEGVICTHLKGNASLPKSYICLPLFSQKEILGLLYVELDPNNKDNQRLISLAHIISEQIAISLYNIKLRESLRTESIHDSLTGLYNRRFFEEYINKELLKIKRNPSHFALLLIDVDFFKRINDTFGHITGDKVLCEVARKLQENCRQSDLVARWGGEEFIIFLRETSLENAQLRAEAIRASVEQLSISMNERPLPPVTISIGISFYPINGDKVEELISKADEALYQAKDSGRNKVIANNRKYLN